MIRGNINLRTVEHTIINNEPFLLKPVGKDYLWGGRRLIDDFNKAIDMEPLAETWECSTHPDGESIVASGKYIDFTLKEVLQLHPEYLGTHPRSNGELPILIKLIDANKDLSVQVHPDDRYAQDHEQGSLGKTEMWYVVDAEKDSDLVYGFKHDMNKELIRQSIYNNTLEKHLQKVRIKKDDVFYVPAGQVHAIGAGAVIAEIQENSNITYRLYDYNRTDKSGKQRELHLEKALEVANLHGSNEPKQPMRVLRFNRGIAKELLCRCKYFLVERIILNTEKCPQMADFKTESNTFQVLLCTDGCGVVLWGKSNILTFNKGDCIFVPANSPSLKIHGQATLLVVGC